MAAAERNNCFDLLVLWLGRTARLFLISCTHGVVSVLIFVSFKFKFLVPDYVQ